MSRSWTGQPGVAAALARNIGDTATEDEQFLLRAFHSFAEAAGSLEASYGILRAEVERLRRELEKSNSDLAHSSEENRSMRAHLDRILEGLPCGVLVVAGGRITRTNPEATRLLTRSAGEAPASLLSKLPAELPTAVRELLESAERDGEEREFQISPADGEPLWLAARYARIDEIAGSSSIFILRDVSERRRWEEAQARQRRDQALAEMSAILAHEIRNPLGSLELFAGLLAESDLAPECHGWVEHLQAGLRTLSATVNNVLHFHSLPEPQRAICDLGLLLGWAHQFLLPLARQSRITLSLQNGLSGVLYPADRHRLEQVLLNLVLNGIRAVPAGGWIELAGRRVPEGITWIVSDTGPGICPADLPHLFEPGFSRRSGSPGLGLAVCRKIIEQHGGTIRAENHKQGGAMFTVTFPLDPRTALHQKTLTTAKTGEVSA